MILPVTKDDMLRCDVARIEVSSQLILVRTHIDHGHGRAHTHSPCRGARRNRPTGGTIDGADWSSDGS